jgi:DNA repair exonuclease SbcCD ATPase subunit
MMFMKNKSDNKNPVVIPANYKIDSTLEQLDSLALAIPQAQEIEQKVEAINEIESLAEINKQQLAVRRARVELEVDNKKLDTAKKAIDNIEKIIDAVSNAEVLERVTKNIKTPMDMKMMAEAAERLTNTLNNLMRPTVADEFGGRKKTKIMAAFKAPTGEQMMISAEIPDND